MSPKLALLERNHEMSAIPDLERVVFYSNELVTANDDMHVHIVAA